MRATLGHTGTARGAEGDNDIVARKAGAGRGDPFHETGSGQQRVLHAGTGKAEQIGQRGGRPHQVERIGAEVGHQVGFLRPGQGRQGPPRPRQRQLGRHQVAHDAAQRRFLLPPVPARRTLLHCFHLGN